MNKREHAIYVRERRSRLKKAIVKLAGGRCRICGYDKCSAALEFHHPGSDKDFGLSYKGLFRSFSSIAEEVSKTVLLCANCHREIHNIPGVECPSPILLSEDDLRRKVHSLETRSPRIEGFHHGTSSGYNLHKCRCTLCKLYHKEAAARYRLKKKTPPEPCS